MTLELALIQMNSSDDMAENIAALEKSVAKAAKQGAQFVATPENTFMMQGPLPNPPPQAGEGIKLYTQDEHPGVKAAAKLAEQYKIWLLIGSVSVIPSVAEGSTLKEDPSTPLRSAQDDKKTYNRSLLFNPSGDVVASYDKIHLFDVEVGDGQTYRESAKMLHGEKAVVVGCGSDGVVEKKETSLPHHSTTPSLTLGLSICYDLRFPQLYRGLAKMGANVLCVPSAFTQVTGEAHWHVLLRARAIENGCFVVAPAQCGTHAGNRKTYGHSLVVNPWGEVVADGGTKPGVVMAEIDLAEVEKARKRIPSLQHDREFT